MQIDLNWEHASHYYDSLRFRPELVTTTRVPIDGIDEIQFPPFTEPDDDVENSWEWENEIRSKLIAFLDANMLKYDAIEFMRFRLISIFTPSDTILVHCQRGTFELQTCNKIILDFKSYLEAKGFNDVHLDICQPALRTQRYHYEWNKDSTRPNTIRKTVRRVARRDSEVRFPLAIEEHPIDIVWENGLGTCIHEMLTASQVDWQSLNLVQYGSDYDDDISDMGLSPVHIWIGVRPGSISLAKEEAVAETVLKILRSFDIQDVCIEILDSETLRNRTLAPPLEGGKFGEPENPIKVSLLGSRICSTNSSACGSIGLLLRNTKNDRTYILTTRQAVAAPGFIKPDETFEDFEGESNIVVEQCTIENGCDGELKKQDLGRLVYAPSIMNLSEEYSRDIALLELNKQHPVLRQPWFGNEIFENGVAKHYVQYRLKPNSLELGRLWLYGETKDEERMNLPRAYDSQHATAVCKFGSTTTITAGFLSRNCAYTRTFYDGSGRPQICKDWVIFPHTYLLSYARPKETFAEAGDIGSSVSFVDGTLVGIVRTSSRLGGVTALSFVMPLTAILQTLSEEKRLKYLKHSCFFRGNAEAE